MHNVYLDAQRRGTHGKTIHMKTIHCYKAATSASGITENLAIIADHEVPLLNEKIVDVHQTVQQQRRMYKLQAEEIVEAMYHHLPGGLVDALLIELLDRKASVFRVAFTKKKSL